MKLMTKKVVALLLALMMVLSIVGCSSEKTQSEKPVAPAENRRDAVGTQGVVAAAHPDAAKVGLEILKKGGNAFDAAVATAFSLGVVEPNASGLGGGGFAIIYVAKEKKSYVVDFREMAPAKATGDFFKRDEKGKITGDVLTLGWYASGVPGETAGLEYINKKFGTMKWAELMDPAIKQAETGIVVSNTLSKIVQEEFERSQKYPSKEFYAKTFYKDGLPVQAGTKIVNPEYAQCLKKISAGGADVFYKGEIADAIAAAYAKDGNGFITKEDLANYKVEAREPITGNYRGYDIVVVPPPSSGGITVLEMLNILEGYDIKKMGWGSPDHIHSFIEAQKIAFADRGKFLGDPGFTKIPTVGMTDKKYAEEMRNRIDMQKAAVNVKPGDPTVHESASTTSFSIIDKEGNMITITKTINDFLGCGVVPAGTGIMMNNEMDDFSAQAGHINAPSPGKRPLSSISPVIVVKDGKPVLTVGSPGGPRIISAVSSVLINILDFGMDIQSAINAARYHNPNSAETHVEKNLPAETIKTLEERGHKISSHSELDLYFGGVQGIILTTDGKLHGGGDPRRDGAAVAY